MCLSKGTAKQVEEKEMAALVALGLGKEGRTPKFGADGGNFKKM